MILEDLGERPAAVVLADHVLGDPLLLLRAAAQERKCAGQCLAETHRARLYSRWGEEPRGRRAVRRTGRARSRRRRQPRAGADLDRAARGRDWAVGRQVNPQHRQTESPRTEDYVWEGHELDDCLEAANAALEDDAVVSEGDGATETIRPFRRDELLAPLERFFFGR